MRPYPGQSPFEKLGIHLEWSKPLVIIVTLFVGIIILSGLVPAPTSYDWKEDEKIAKSAKEKAEIMKMDRRGKARTVQILVLGDIGRSPRMQYHALSVAKHGSVVHLIGYCESPLHPDLIGNPRVTVYPISSPPGFLKRLPFILGGPLKVLLQLASIARILFWASPACQYLLVQNPPSIPTLFLAEMVTQIRSTRVIVDWHNYGWSILANTKGPNHPFIPLAQSHEAIFGKGFNHFWNHHKIHLTVTEAMRKDLQNKPYNIPAAQIRTLHDRPAEIFQPLTSPSQRETFLTTLPQTKEIANTILSGQTKLIVSSTSWTPDEDFSLLLDALVTYAQKASTPIMAIITGKGPQKSLYESRINDLVKSGQLPNIRILTAWLSIEDYASLLACADLGICLHKSTSGVDLPMKVVDMFGSGLPVAAYSGYESFDELVKEGVNGCGFETADELAAILSRLFGTPRGEEELEVLRRGARKESELRWDEEWGRVLGEELGIQIQLACDL
ncbi:glycosyltransferase family 33 protein [Poronia punctata]|nr:glycosyltransferase family 33 protein [Poronia punctata]